MYSWREILKDKTFIIAEIGKNFIMSEEESDKAVYLNNAKRLVSAAYESSADAVKFQTHCVEDEQLDIKITSPHFKGSDRYNWVKRNTSITPKKDFWIPLSKYCKDLGMYFFSTPMSRGAAKILEEINVPFWKIGSGDILDFVMLDYIAGTKKPVVFSSGMSTLKETDKAIDFLRERGVDIALLHCVSKYPCPPEELNLSTISYYNKRYDIPIGFSDHSIGYEAAVAAVALGARIIEKHFSLSRDLWGSDHKVSMTPDEFRTMVYAIRELEQCPKTKQKYLQQDVVKKSMGKLSKRLQKGEETFRPLFRKSLMAGKTISKGTVITPSMLYAMRPQAHAGGLPSEEYENVIGRKATRDLKKYDPIKISYISKSNNHKNKKNRKNSKKVSKRVSKKISKKK